MLAIDVLSGTENLQYCNTTNLWAVRQLIDGSVRFEVHHMNSFGQHGSAHAGSLVSIDTMQSGLLSCRCIIYPSLSDILYRL